jgi:WhiB family redox-sensing transcriptional regulator
MTARRHLGEIVADRPGGAQPTPVIVVPDEPWRDDAICAQTDPEAFFPEKGGSTREAKQICRSCDVRPECLDYALAHNERFGIWGGLSERDRRRLARGITTARKPGHTLTVAQEGEVCRLYRAGLTSTHIADLFGVSDHLVLRRLRENEIPIRKRGGRHPRPQPEQEQTA